MEYLVHRGGRHAVLPYQIADAKLVGVIVIVQLLALDWGQTGAFVDSHVVYSNPMADCKQR